MTVTESIKAKLDEAAYIIRMQTARIAELEAELEGLKSTLDAHGTLRLIYSNRNLPESLRAKAASAAIQHETPKLMPERQALELTAEPATMTLAQLGEYRMKKQERLSGQDIQVQPNGQVVVLKPGNGNGQDDDTTG